MKPRRVASFAVLVHVLCASSFAVLPGCSASRDVEISGIVTEHTTRGASGPIRIEFYEAVGSGADAGPSAAPELELVDTETLAGEGRFDATVMIEGDLLYVVAVLDTNQSNACDDGESWGDARATVGNDGKASAEVNIAPAAHCMPMTTLE